MGIKRLIRLGHACLRRRTLGHPVFARLARARDRRLARGQIGDSASIGALLVTSAHALAVANVKYQDDCTVAE